MSEATDAWRDHRSLTPPTSSPTCSRSSTGKLNDHDGRRVEIEIEIDSSRRPDSSGERRRL
jgi:hypothetical protein